jgi:hypothetical protein
MLFSQERPEHSGVAMLDVSRSKDKRHVITMSELTQMIECGACGLLGKLGYVARTKLREPGGIMRIPFAQISARSNIPKPLINSRTLSRQAARPETLYKDTYAVVRSRLVIRALEHDEMVFRHTLFLRPRG